MSDILLEVRGIAKRFGGEHALRPLDLTLRTGDRVAVLGPNGAGKSTLLRLLSGLARASAGSIELPGVARARRGPALRRRVGYVGHASLLYPALTVTENLVFTGRLYGVDQPAERAAHLVRELKLEDFAERRVRHLSRGVAQRVAVARALMHEPELLLLDEPFSGLDPEAAPALEARIESLMAQGAGGRALVFVTHDLASAARLCDRALILRGGLHRECRVSRDEGAMGRLYAESQDALAMEAS